MIDFAARRTMMVDTQVRPNDVTKFPVIDAMLAVPQEEFLPAQLRAVAYSGENLDLGNGRVVLEPRTLSKMLDGLDIQREDLVLDLGCGLGYSSAVIAHIAQAVVAVEEDPDMAAEAERRLNAAGVFNVAVIAGPLAAGNAAQAPYDVIVIQGGVEEIPQPVLDQLADGGRIAALFVENNLGVVRFGQKVAGHVNWRYGFNAYAPLLAGFALQRGFSL